MSNSPRDRWWSRRVALWIAAGLLFSMLPANGGVAVAASVASRPDLPHAKDHVLVKLTAGSRPDGVLGKGARPIMGRWHAHPVPSGKSPVDTVNAVLKRPGVETAELDYRVQVEPPSEQEFIAQSFEVNDRYFSYQWHLPAVQADDAWSISKGRGVVVAVVDSGVSQGGVDLDCHTFVAPYNAITQTAGAEAAADDDGHGTHVAGTIAQCTNNRVGVAGVAFNARLMPVKVLDQNGLGTFSSIARGIDWARAKGADVINLSLGCDGCTSSLMDEAIEAARAAGIVIVAASGNRNETKVSYPASHPDVIAVGATDFNNARAPYSNRGSALDLVAPGGDLSKDANGDGFGDGVLQETFGGSVWGYYFLEGTSMATPHVSAAAAMLLAKDPCLGAREVQQVLQDSALELGPAGVDTTFGHGLIQIADALGTLPSDHTAPKWPGSGKLTASEITGNSVELSWKAASDNRCVTGYRIYRGDSLVKKVGSSQTATTLSGLKPLTDYAFEVRAVDGAGNSSDPLSVAVTTLDNVPPTWSRQAKLSVVTYGETSLELAWDAAADATGIAEYRLLIDGQTVVTKTGRGATVTGLEPGQEYFVQVLARDRAGDWSDPLVAVFSTARQFGDTSGHTFFGDILWMSGSGVTRGCNPPINDLFCPDDPVTRGQMAAFLVRALGLSANSHPGFGDVPAASTFAEDIGRLATAGVTRGCNPPVNDLFCPEDPVTRGQLAAFLRRGLS